MDSQFNRFTQNAKQSLIAAQKIASLHSESITPKHIILGLLTIKEGLAFDVLVSFGVTSEKVNSIIDFENRKEETSGLSVQAKRTIEKALEYAKKFNQLHVGTEHLLLASIIDAEVMDILEKLNV